MYRVLLTVPLPWGPYTLTSYKAALVTSMLLMVALGAAIALRRRLPLGRSAAVLGAAALAVPVGARAWHALTNPSIYFQDPGYLLTPQPTGFALFGGLAGAALAGALASRVLAVDLWRLADAAAPALGVAIAVMRLGCFSNGCCFGHTTDGAFGVRFPAGSPAHLWQLATDKVRLLDAPLPVHPTQLYEAAGALACAAIALAIARRAPSGVAFATFIGGFAVVRTANWTLRVHPDTITDPAIYWPLYAAVALACALLAWWRLSRGAIAEPDARRAA